MKVQLFTYGRLQPKYSPPATMVAHEPDFIYGTLYDRGHDPLAIQPGQDHIDGTLITMDDYEFWELDRIEKGYRRTPIITGRGKKAFVYLWDGPLPPNAKRITKWPVK